MYRKMGRRSRPRTCGPDRHRLLDEVEGAPPARDGAYWVVLNRLGENRGESRAAAARRVVSRIIFTRGLVGCSVLACVGGFLGIKWALSPYMGTTAEATGVIVFVDFHCDVITVVILVSCGEGRLCMEHHRPGGSIVWTKAYQKQDRPRFFIEGM